MDPGEAPVLFINWDLPVKFESSLISPAADVSLLLKRNKNPLKWLFAPVASRMKVVPTKLVV